MVPALLRLEGRNSASDGSCSTVSARSVHSSREWGYIRHWYSRGFFWWAQVNRSQAKMCLKPTLFVSVMIWLSQMWSPEALKLGLSTEDCLPCSLKFSTCHWDTLCRIFHFSLPGRWNLRIQVYSIVLKSIILSEILDQLLHSRRIKHLILCEEKRQVDVSVTTFFSNYTLYNSQTIKFYIV